MSQDAIRAALRKTPIPSWVKLVVEQDDPSRAKLVASATVPGAWIAGIYAVRKNGLPLYWPATTKRSRAQRFIGSFVVTADTMTNWFRISDAARVLLEHARKRLKARRGALKAVRTMRRRGTQKAGPGRPRGILRSMEKTGSNRDRNCPDCGNRHRKTPCVPRREP